MKAGRPLFALRRMPRSASFSFRSMSSITKLNAPPLVFVKGEEMTRYVTELMLEKWITPHISTKNWQYFDLSAKNRDVTKDQVLKDVVEAGKKVGAIFKEPTITPTEEQRVKMGLSKAWGSPNGAMRRGWNGITISRDTIMIRGIQLGYKKPVFFERHAVGGEYSAGFKMVKKGKIHTLFYPDDGGTGLAAPVLVDERTLTNEVNMVVTYDNPLDNVGDLAHHFFGRCLKSGITPYVVTKKTVFKWQEPFWLRMKEVFDLHYKKQFKAAGLLEKTGGELQHLISDAATMQIIRWTDGGFGMAAHNYDGDMLTDEVSQVHRSPGFLTSTLIGKRSTGGLIKEFEASHGTVSDLYHAHLRGERTSLNPLGLAEALIGAMQHSVIAAPPGTIDEAEGKQLIIFGNDLREALHGAFREGKGTWDLAGPSGLTTEEFIEEVSTRLNNVMQKRAAGELPEEADSESDAHLVAPAPTNDKLSLETIKSVFDEIDVDHNGNINLEEFTKAMIRLNVQPKIVVRENNKDSEVAESQPANT